MYVRKILSYANEKNILVYMTLPFVGQYSQNVKAVNISKTLSFLDYKFYKKRVENMRY